MHALRYVGNSYWTGGSSVLCPFVYIQFVLVQAGEGTADTGFGRHSTIHRLLYSVAMRITMCVAMCKCEIS